MKTFAIVAGIVAGVLVLWLIFSSANKPIAPQPGPAAVVPSVQRLANRPAYIPAGPDHTIQSVVVENNQVQQQVRVRR